MNTIKFQKLHNDAKMPTRAYVPEGFALELPAHQFELIKSRGSKILGAVGFDLYPVQDGYLIPNCHSIVPLGFATEFDYGYGAFIFDRSGMGVRGVARLAGVIDPDYRGEWKAILYNTTNESLHYTREKAIAQVVFLKVEFPEWVETQELAPSLRDTKGFGSSDIPVGRVIDVTMGLRSKGGYNEGQPNPNPNPNPNQPKGW